MKEPHERSRLLQTSQPQYLIEAIEQAAKKKRRSLSEEVRQALLPVYFPADSRLEDKQKTGKLRK